MAFKWVRTLFALAFLASPRHGQRVTHVQSDATSDYCDTVDDEYNHSSSTIEMDTASLAQLDGNHSNSTQEMDTTSLAPLDQNGDSLSTHSPVTLNNVNEFICHFQDDQPSAAFRALQGTMVTLVTVLGISFNLIVFVIIVRSKRLNSDISAPSLLSLTLSDLGMASTCGLMGCVIYFGKHCQLHDVLMKFNSFCYAFFCSTSIYSLAGLSLVKMTSVIMPLKFHLILTRGRCSAANAIAWLAAAGLCSPILINVELIFSPAMLLSTFKPTKSLASYFLVLATVSYIIPSVAIAFAYIRIFIIVKNVNKQKKVSRRPIAFQIPSNSMSTSTSDLSELGTHPSSMNVSSISLGRASVPSTMSSLPATHVPTKVGSSLKNALKSAKKISIVCFSYYIAYTPLFTASIYNLITYALTVEPAFFSVWLAISNCFIDSLVYACLHPVFQAELKKQLKQLIKKV